MQELWIKYITIIFGLVALFKWVPIHLFPEKWNKFELQTAYTKKQPKWLWIAAFIGILIITTTWYAHFTTNIPYSIIISVVLTLTLIKSSQLLFNYQNFRKFAVEVTETNPKKLLYLNIFTALVGLCLVYLGIFIY